MRLAVTWQMCGFVEIPDAETYEEALEIFDRDLDHIQLPADAEYVDGSFEPSTYDAEEQEAICSQE